MKKGLGKNIEKVKKLKQEWLKIAGESPEPMDLLLILMMRIDGKLARLEGWLAGVVAVIIGLLLAIAMAVL